MNITYRNGLPPSYLRVLTVLAILQSKGRIPTTYRTMSREMGGISHQALYDVLHRLQAAGLVGGVSEANAIHPTCRFYTYEELNPKEEPNADPV